VRRLLSVAAIAGVALASVLAPSIATAAPTTVGTTAAPSTVVTSAAPAAAVAADPIARFGGCLAGGGTGDIVLLFDESGSLQATDPKNDRVTAGRYLVRQLTSFAENSGASINVKVATFASDYSSIGEWTELTGTGPQTVDDSVASVKKMVNGFETDYWTALEGARRDLSERTASRGESISCQAIAWFTDGAMRFTPRTTSAELDKFGSTKAFADTIVLRDRASANKVEVAARDQLCRPGGLADQLRSSDIVIFAIGLQGSADPGEFGFLNSVATGTDPDTSTDCGAILDPVPGTFALASDIDQLLFAFDAIGTPGSTGLQQEAGICKTVGCDAGTHRFVLDASTPVVHVLATADADTFDLSLTSPSGEVAVLTRSTVGTSSTATLEGSTLEYIWQSDRTIEIDLATVENSPNWTGLWELSFVDPDGVATGKRSLSNIHIFSDYLPSWLNPDATPLYTGDLIEGVELGVVDKTGEAVDLDDLLGSLSLTAVLTDADGTRVDVATDLTAKDLASPQSLNLDGLRAGAGKLSLELAITTAPITKDGKVTVPGTALEPQSLDIPLSILPPLNFPVLPSTVNFGVLDGSTTATAQLDVQGEGCVWIEPSSAVTVLAAPEKVGDIAVTLGDAVDAGSCLAVSGPVELELSIDELDNGSINGTLQVMTAPKGEADRAVPATVEFTADVRRPINAGNFLVSLVVALILGPGIPIALLYLFKWLAAKIPSRALLVERVPVTISDGRVLRSGATFALLPTDFRDIVGIPGGGSRSLTAAGVSLTTHTGASPTGAGFVLARVDGTVSASDSSPASKNTQARLPLAVHNHWVVFRTPGAPEGAAEVLLLVSADADVDRKATLIDDLNSRLPDVYARLVEESGDSAPESTGSSAPSGFDSPSAAPAASGFGFDSYEAPTTGNSSGSGFGFSEDPNAGNTWDR